MRNEPAAVTLPPLNSGDLLPLLTRTPAYKRALPLLSISLLGP
jgi:hypothetical protein